MDLGNARKGGYQSGGPGAGFGVWVDCHSVNDRSSTFTELRANREFELTRVFEMPVRYPAIY